jgi:tRNA dimethylallyltransferase
MSFNNKPKIVTVVGPTASGKTSLSIALAKNFSGEVISADSRQVYRGLDLGSGKVTKEEMLGIPHHLLDIADPMQVYTASDFTRDGEQAIRDIFIRSHTPIIAGGTFMYLDTLLGKISVPEVPPNPALRTELESLDTNVLIERLRALDPARTETIDPDNPRRLIRAIEIATALGHVPSTIEPVSPYEVLTIGLRLPKEELHNRIHTRLLERLEAGMVAEVKDLLEQGVPHTRLEDLGLEYRYISRYLQCALSYEDMVSTLETKIRQFAKRQMTWLKRDKLIKWFHPTEQEAIFSTVTNFLQD